MTTSLAPSWLAVLVAFQPTVSQEIALGAAAAVTLVGVWMCWGAPRYRMALEERVKDGKITADDAGRKIQRSQWIGPCVTIIGVTLLLYVIAR
jgi:hypothetical protein